MSAKPLEGRVVVVTGAGRGLGREHAIRLAQEGAYVVVNDLRDETANPAKDVLEEIRSAGGKAVTDSNSVTTWDSAARIVQTALSEFGRLDGIVCNAGFLRDRMLTNMSEAEWDDIIKVHQYGTFYILRHAAEHWRNEHKAGKPVNASVVTTTAASGLHSNIGQVNYGAAKAAIALMTISSARELSRYGVRVNSISPLARTRLTEQNFMPPSRPGEFDDRDPAHVSALVAWLLTAECKVTAQVYGIFGREIHRYTGWTAAEMAKSDKDWTINSIEDALRDWPSDFVARHIPGIPDRREKAK